MAGQDELWKLLEAVGLQVLQLDVHERTITNHRENRIMHRRWIQVKALRPEDTQRIPSPLTDAHDGDANVTRNGTCQHQDQTGGSQEAINGSDVQTSVPAPRADTIDGSSSASGDCYSPTACSPADNLCQHAEYGRSSSDVMQRITDDPASQACHPAAAAAVAAASQQAVTESSCTNAGSKAAAEPDHSAHSTPAPEVPSARAALLGSPALDHDAAPVAAADARISGQGNTDDDRTTESVRMDDERYLPEWEDDEQMDTGLGSLFGAASLEV